MRAGFCLHQRQRACCSRESTLLIFGILFSLEKEKSLLLAWNKRQQRVTQLVRLRVVVDGVIALHNELNWIAYVLAWTLGLIVVAPVNVVFASKGVGWTSQKLSGVLVGQFLVANAKSAGSVYRRLSSGKLVSFRVDVDIGSLGLYLGSVSGLVRARQVQNVVIVGFDSAEKGGLVSVKHKVMAIPLQQVVLENGTFVMGNDGKNWGRWLIQALIDGEGRYSREEDKKVCKEELHFEIRKNR